MCLGIFILIWTTFYQLGHHLETFKKLTHSFPMHPSCTPWKHQKTVRFSNVFTGYRKGAFGTNGLIDVLSERFSLISEIEWTQSSLSFIDLNSANFIFHRSVSWSSLLWLLKKNLPIDKMFLNLLYHQICKCCVSQSYF